MKRFLITLAMMAMTGCIPAGGGVGGYDKGDACVDDLSRCAPDADLSGAVMPSDKLCGEACEIPQYFEQARAWAEFIAPCDNLTEIETGDSLLGGWRWICEDEEGSYTFLAQWLINREEEMRWEVFPPLDAASYACLEDFEDERRDRVWLSSPPAACD